MSSVSIGRKHAMLMNLGSRRPEATFLVDHDSNSVEIVVPITAKQAEELGSKLYREVDIEFVAHWSDPEESACARCADTGCLPSHEGSTRCRNRTSIASGGTVSHCTCNACF